MKPQRRKQGGFFLVDWVTGFFQGSIWVIAIKLVVLAFCGWMLTVFYSPMSEALEVQKVMKESVRSTKDDGLGKFYSQLVASLSRIEGGNLSKRLESKEITPNDIFTLEGKGDDRILSVEYDHKVPIFSVIGSRVAIVVSFSFDTGSSKSEVLFGKKKEKTDWPSAVAILAPAPERGPF